MFDMNWAGGWIELCLHRKHGVLLHGSRVMLLGELWNLKITGTRFPTFWDLFEQLYSARHWSYYHLKTNLYSVFDHHSLSSRRSRMAWQPPDLHRLPASSDNPAFKVFCDSPWNASSNLLRMWILIFLLDTSMFDYTPKLDIVLQKHSG